MTARKETRGSKSIASTIDALAALKGVFEDSAASQMETLLRQPRTQKIRDPGTLIQLHEILLFLRAYPQNRTVLEFTDQLLSVFGDRVRALGELSWEDSQLFEAGEVSGIAGTGLSTNFSYSFARPLVDRHGTQIQIDWDNYFHSDRLGPVLARLSPLANEDWTVEGHLDWRQWFEAITAKTKIGALKWLLDRIDPATYDLLEIPLVWDLGDSSATRSRTRIPRRKIFYHDAPLLKRRDISLEAEFAKPAIKARRLPPREAQRIFDIILDTSAVRYRELWGFMYPDVAYIDHADLGRGLDMYWFGVPAASRLPLRAYHCGMFFKNGVPIGYVEVLSLFERMEVGFNLYYTFREGESAWLYAQVLKFCRERYGVTCFSIDPYQLGHENEEAIASGAFWFYRKLGFHSTSPEIARLIEKEEAKLAQHPDHRTSPKLLRRMAEAHLMYCEPREHIADWDGFSLRTLLQRVAVKTSGRSVPGKPLSAWAAILANVRRSEVTADQLIAAKNAVDEIGYLKLLQSSPKLRRAVLKLGAAK